jgi:drug/metabolite transporter (DMT)-like permease
MAEQDGLQLTRPSLSTAATLSLFAVVVTAWGLNWTVTKLIVMEMSPLWAAAIRTAIAAIALLPVLALTGQFIVPARGDVPVILAISLFHMVAFSALMTAGLKYVPVGRSIVLGYTTPLWVAPAAWFFMNESLSPQRIVGIILGIAGLVFMFNPAAINWSDQQAIFGNGLLLLSALAWSVSILYTRAHRWIATPFQLVFWEVLLATVVLTALAAVFEGRPTIIWTTRLVVALGYSGIVGNVLGFWAMTVVNRSVPATTTSIGILATPVVGIASSAILLGEMVDTQLIIAATMILLGMLIANVNFRKTRSWLTL